MGTREQWNDAGFCFRNAEVLRKTGMPVAASVWAERADELMAQLCGKDTVDQLEGLLRGGVAGNA